MPPRDDLLIVIGVPVAACLLALLFGVLLPHLRRRRRSSGQIVVVPFMLDGGPLSTPVPRRTLPHGTPTTAPEPETPPPAAAAATGTYGSPSTGAELELPAPRLQVVSDDPPTPRAEPRPAEGRVAMRNNRPPVEATLQFLPGRLEIIEGRDIGQEIRFVRTPGAQVTEITIGRSSGPMYRHIQLHEPTVSRLHAKMTLEGRQWRITNLSATNPVVVNSSPLTGEGTSVLLADGDRIELGEVVLRFRSS